MIKLVLLNIIVILLILLFGNKLNFVIIKWIKS